MKRFIAGEDRRQVTLLPDCLDDYIAADNPVRLVEVFVDELDLTALGFAGAVPEATGRPAYHPATLLKIYLYGYLNRVPSSRRLERETQRNVELIWLTGRLMPDFKTLADFRCDNGPAIQAACAQFMALCRRLNLFGKAVVAIDGSKFKAVNNRDRNFTAAKVEARLAQPRVVSPLRHAAVSHQKILYVAKNCRRDRSVALSIRCQSSIRGGGHQQVVKFGAQTKANTLRLSRGDRLVGRCVLMRENLNVLSPLYH
jgi:transposase